MKKIYAFLFLTFLFSLNREVNAQLLLSEDFEAGQTLPTGWTNNDIAGNGEIWQFNNPGGRTFNPPISGNFAIFDSDYYGNGNAAEDAALESPIFDAGGLSIVILEFDHYFYGGFGGAYSVEVFDGTSWISVLSGTSSVNNHEYLDVSSQLAGVSNAQVRFHWTGDFSWYWAVDNIVVSRPSCYPPTNLFVPKVSQTQAYLNWTAGSGETAWNIEYGITGFTQGQGTTINVSTNPYTLTGLLPETSYDCYVQADCGNGTGSTWEGPYTFTTIPACGGTFYDDGGPNDSYSPNFNMTYTFYPDNPGEAVTITFDRFNIQQGMDGMMIYDGADTTAPLFDSGSTYNSNLATCPHGAWTGGEGIIYNYSAYGKSFTATNLEGALTLVFTSNNRVQYAGWEASIACASLNCPASSNLSVSNILTHQADLSWTPGGNETAWEIEYGISGFTQGQGAIVNASTNPYTLTGLNDATYYDYYVRSNCGSGEYSIWSGPYTFRTTCDIVSTYPYNYGFENVSSNSGGNWDSSCWSGDPQNTGAGENDAPYRWTVTNGNTVTPMYETGPAGAHTGTQYACTKSVDSHAGDQAELISPVFDMSSLNYPQVSFYYYMYGEDGMGTLTLDVYDGTTWTNDVWSITGQQQTSETESWLMAIVSIPANTTQFRFRAIRPGNFVYVSEIAVDDITIMDAPSCPRPTGQSVTNIYTDQVDLSWAPGGNETAWNIEYGPTGFTQGQGTTVNVTDNPYTLSGLQEATYDYYIQADCGGNTSPWIGPFIFSTNCGVVKSFPYEYGFEDIASNDSYEWDNSCWSTEQSLSNYFWLVTDNNTPTDLTGPDGAHSGTQYAYTEADPSASNYDQALLISPVFDMSSLTEPQVSFYYYMYGSNIGILSLDTFDGNTWTNSVWQVSGQQQTNGSDLWLQAYVSIPRNTIQFRLRGNSSLSNGNHSDIAVDDILVSEDTGAIADHQIKGLVFYPNPVNHTLNISAADNVESVRIYNVTGQEVIETKPGSNRTQIDMRRLPNGVYFVKAQIKGELTAFKVVKK